LTSSSARKLKRGSANLLAGRAFTYKLFPLTHLELAKQFDLNQALTYGTLPKLLEYEDNNDKVEFLRSYTQTYLREEIQIEQLVRRLNPFRDFLELAAQNNGEILNYTKISRDIGVDHKTVANYYQILEDTLVGFYLPPFHKSVRKRQLESPKFYLFDTGVKRALERSFNIPLNKRSYAYGKAFEHFVILEFSD
jgi:predicted AAA+ superfamily ATPase